MPSQSNLTEIRDRDLADYGYAHARDIAFDAIQLLWKRRRDEGMSQKDLSKAIKRQPAWVSRNLRGPGNWTLRTIGELTEALRGQLEITVHPIEDCPAIQANYEAYLGYEPPQGVIQIESDFFGVNASGVVTASGAATSDGLIQTRYRR